MDLFTSFLALPLANSGVEFSAVQLKGARRDYLAKSCDGGAVFLLHDASAANYSPAIELKYVSVQFHSTCRVIAAGGVIEDQFAVISCDANTSELHEIFIRCVGAAVEQLPLLANTSDLQRCVQALLDLFRTLGRPSSREVAGLWAELFVILQSKNVAQALSCWRADQFERFDFSWPSGCLEVKAAVREVRQHEFALEQLQEPSGGVGYVASVLLQPLSGGMAIVDLANDIERIVASQPLLRQKLWKNIVATLGSDFSERLDRKFDSSYAERSLSVYSMSDVPVLHEPFDPRITKVRFCVDMTTVSTSLAGNPRDVLEALFT
nr:PD-(D/E)XK motif protein [uncultured Achromobacter sp.]